MPALKECQEASTNNPPKTKFSAENCYCPSLFLMSYRVRSKKCYATDSLPRFSSTMNYLIQEYFEKGYPTRFQNLRRKKNEKNCDEIDNRLTLTPYPFLFSQPYRHSRHLPLRRLLGIHSWLNQWQAGPVSPMVTDGIPSKRGVDREPRQGQQ